MPQAVIGGCPGQQKAIPANGFRQISFRIVMIALKAIKLSTQHDGPVTVLFAFRRVEGAPNCGAGGAPITSLLGFKVGELEPGVKMIRLNHNSAPVSLKRNGRITVKGKNAKIAPGLCRAGGIGLGKTPQLVKPGLQLAG